jgi:hypothetical protein
MRKIRIKKKSLDRLKGTGPSIDRPAIDWDKGKDKTPFSQLPAKCKPDYNPKYDSRDVTETEKVFNSAQVPSIKEARRA